MASTNILDLEPVKKFLQVVGHDIKEYFGKDKACIVYLRPDGEFYAEGLYQWLRKKKKNVTLTALEDDEHLLDKNKVRGCKLLIVDNDIVTGKGYKRSVEALRTHKKELGIKDIKFATYFDRVGLADFSVAKYSAEAIWHMDEMDAIDLKIISYLSQDGREALAEIGKKVRLSSVAVKNRLDKLFKEKILRVQASLNIDQFYTMSAQIQLEADEKTVEELIEKFEKMQEVYYLVRTTSGRYNLMLGVLAHNLDNIKDFLESEIRIVPGVRQIDLYVGEVPIMPNTVPPRL